MKMTRKITSLFLAVAMLLSLFTMTGCTSSNNVFTKTDNTIFDIILADYEESDIDILYMSAYSYKGTVYYKTLLLVLDKETGKQNKISRVYYGRDEAKDYFDLDGKNDNPVEAAYREAVEKGRHKLFMQDQIDDGIKAFYKSIDDSNRANYVLIEPTDEQFKAAEDIEYFNPYEKITEQSIKTPYSVSLFYYKAPTDGYYRIWTTGNTDTVGKVFKKSTFWGSTTGYESLTSAMDSGAADTNFGLVVEMQKNNHYYIGVRGFEAETGNYVLNIEPNSDRKFTNVGGIWVNSDPDDDVVSIEYFNEAQVEALYKLLCNEEALAEIKKEYVKYGTVTILLNLRAKGLTKFSYYPTAKTLSDTADGDMLSIVPAVYQGSVLIGEAAIAEIMSICCQTDKAEAVKKQLEEICGMTQRENGTFSKPVCGLMIKKTNSFWGTKSSYYSFTGIEINGELYKKGLWS